MPILLLICLLKMKLSWLFHAFRPVWTNDCTKDGRVATPFCCTEQRDSAAIFYLEPVVSNWHQIMTKIYLRWTFSSLAEFQPEIIEEPPTTCPVIHLSHSLWFDASENIPFYWLIITFLELRHITVMNFALIHQCGRDWLRQTAGGGDDQTVKAWNCHSTNHT